MADDKAIKIELTHDEYRKLIELTYLGEWFVNAHHDAEFQDETATEILQQVLGSHDLAGVGRDIETGNYYLDNEWSERLFDQYIIDYDDHVFWDELTERLAQRDLARKRRVPVEQINRDDDILELKPIEERYRRELEASGIDRLELGHDF
jgi:hypothetical protein